jgi:hypothetical protein
MLLLVLSQNSITSLPEYFLRIGFLILNSGDSLNFENLRIYIYCIQTMVLPESAVQYLSVASLCTHMNCVMITPFVLQETSACRREVIR